MGGGESCTAWILSNENLPSFYFFAALQPRYHIIYKIETRDIVREGGMGIIDVCCLDNGEARLKEGLSQRGWLPYWDDRFESEICRVKPQTAATYFDFLV